MYSIDFAGGWLSTGVQVYVGFIVDEGAHNDKNWGHYIDTAPDSYEILVQHYEGGYNAYCPGDRASTLRVLEDPSLSPGDYHLYGWEGGGCTPACLYNFILRVPSCTPPQ